MSPNFILNLLEATNLKVSNAFLAPAHAKHDDLQDLVILNYYMWLVHETGRYVLLMILENCGVFPILQGLIMYKFN